MCEKNLSYTHKKLKEKLELSINDQSNLPADNLISSAVLINAISVDVKWTVRSVSEIGMFILTKRCGKIQIVMGSKPETV